MNFNQQTSAEVSQGHALLKTLVFGLVLMWSLFVQARPEIFRINEDIAHRAHPAAEGFTSVSINTSDLFALTTLSSASLNLPGRPSVPVIHDRVETHHSGNKTWIGYLENFGKNFRVLITTGPAGTSGRIALPGAEYLINSKDGQTWLVDTKAAGLNLALPRGNDAIVPPARTRALATAIASLAPVSGDSAPTPQSTVDVMVVYTPSLVAQLGSSLQTGLDHLVAIANQAYIDSEVAIRIRLVHSALVNYSDTNDNSDALDDISGLNGHNIPSSLASVASWRNSYGADLVVLMRAFNHTTQRGCGVAWVGGMDASTLVGYDDTGYAVVSHGDSGSYFCDETTLAHELGHNMGSMHDHRTDPFSTSGVFSYSFGHGVDNAFSTIMAYPSSFTNGPTIGKFSNPLIDCVGRPCGVSGSANNALSMNNVRAQVANYRPTTVTGTYALSVSKTGRGSGTVASADSAINCGSACAASYSANTVVSLTATPAQNSIFAGWADACSGVGACNVSMGSSQRVVANFSLGEVVLDVPGAPGIGAAVAGDMSASIAFTAPANDGGATIDLYRATCSGGIYATGTVSPIIVAGLSNGGTYFCTVAAHNSQGWGPESGISNMVTPKSTVNQTVVALNLTNLSGSSGNSQFYSFVVPTGASNLLVQTIGVGSGDVDLYVRYGSQPTASEYDCGSENYSNNELCLIDSPTLGTYFVELFAYESFSGVNLLISYNSNVTASVPDAPVNVAAIAGVESASVLFSAPFSNGGATIDNYRASCGGGIGTSTISPIVVTGLTNGVSYTCTVSAHNSVGWGPESAASNSFTPQASTPTPIPFNLITHYYTNILNRVADDGGKAFWQSEVNRMSNLSVSPNEAYIALALNFFTSAEFLARGFGDEQFVRNLYLTFYNREADQGGLDYWRGLLSSGLPRDMIMYAFMFSPEFGNFMIQNIGATYQRPEVGAVIDYYRGAFGRLPDDGGLKYWVNQFRVAQCSGNPTAGVYTAATSIASAFFGSAEYNNAAPSANKYISDLFNAFMRRSADLEGYNFWVSQVATGAQSKDAVRQQFVDSPEFAARVQAIVGAACTGMMQ